jgi:anti-sigma B factor antagonist
MAIEVTSMQTRGIEVVAISGKIVGSAQSSREFHDLIRGLVAEGKRKFVIDLTETPWTNSLGVGMLMGAYSTVKTHGGEVVLANATGRIMDLLKVTQLTRVFEVLDSLDAAIDRVTAIGNDPPTQP